jgi:glycosyltransferase involved in cell wall biosynthesis
MTVLAIDLTYRPYGGSYTQILNIFKNIEEYKSEKFIIYSTEENYDRFKKFKSNVVVFKVSKIASFSKVTRILWVQIVLPFLLLFDEVSLLFCPGNFSPIIAFTKKVQWIGTVGPFENDFYKGFSLFHKINLWINKYIMLISAYTSNHVIFESEYTRNLFKNRFSFDVSKASIIYLGKDSFFYPIECSSEPKVKEFCEKKYILSVSHLYPYKNIETILDSFSKLDDQDIFLIIAGAFHTESYHQKLIDISENLSIRERVVFLGEVSKTELRELYTFCKILVFSSPFENFAYTLVEAMSCGAPIIASDSTAMPETCKSAAKYFSPYSSKELFQEIISFINDHDLREKYKRKSLHRSSQIDDYKRVNISTSKIINELLKAPADLNS